MSLRIGPELVLPKDAVTQTFGILAVRGAGKSNTAVVMAEEMYDAQLPFCAIDPVGSWWGLRSSSDGKGPGLRVPIFGGEHGDVPLERTSGELLADLVADKSLSCVVDLSGFDSEAAKKAFLLAFAVRLYRRNRNPLHLFLEEADDYIPQRPMRDEAHLLRAWENIVRRGRARGIGITLVTQRSASLNKSVLTQVETLFAMRTTGPQDRNAIEEWVKYHAQSRELLASLAELADGEAWCWSPHWLGKMARVKVRRRRTFDSGATPKHGGARRAATLADVDLPALQAEWTTTIERLKADDPKALRARIAELERAAKAPAAESSRVIEVPVFSAKEAAALSAIGLRLERTEKAVAGLGKELEQTTVGVRNLLGLLQRFVEAPLHVPPPRLIARPTSNGAPPTTRREGKPLQSRPVTSADTSLKKGARRMLEVLVRLHPAWLSRQQLATLAGISPSSGTFSDYLSALRRADLFEEAVDGTMRATRLGQQRAPLLGCETEPLTAEQVLAQWTRRLKAGARRMLDELRAVGPDTWLTRQELAQRAGIESSSGTFSDYLSMLRRNGLAEVQGAQVRVSPTITMGAP